MAPTNRNMINPDTDEIFTNLDRVVMKTFGQSYILTQADGSTTTLEGVLSWGTKSTGQYDAMMQSQTTITVPSSTLLQRNDLITRGAESWRVDRKLKDDGYLAKWSLHGD